MNDKSLEQPKLKATGENDSNRHVELLTCSVIVLIQRRLGSLTRLTNISDLMNSCKHGTIIVITKTCLLPAQVL